MSYSGSATAFSAAGPENLKPAKPPTTYKPSTSANGDVDHGKRQHELQLNFKVKIMNKSPHKPVKLDPSTLQDRIAINEEAVLEDQVKSYEQASVPELKELLKERGLPTAGKKNELVERLLSQRQPITLLHIGSQPDRVPSPTGSPKVKAGPNSPRYAPYSGSLSPRFQDHISARMVSNLSISSSREENDLPDGVRCLEQDYVAPPLGSPVETIRPRAHSIEPGLMKTQIRRISSDNNEFVSRTREKVMGRSSSTSVLPMWKAPARAETGTEPVEVGPRMHRAMSNELYPTSSSSLPGYLHHHHHHHLHHHHHQGPAYSQHLGSIDETNLESASALFFQENKKQFPTAMGSNQNNNYGQGPYGHVNQSSSSPSPPQSQPFQLASYSGIADNQYLVGQEVPHTPSPPQYHLQQTTPVMAPCYPVNEMMSPECSPLYPGQRPDVYSLGVRSSSDGQVFADDGYHQDFYIDDEEPGYIMKKELVDFKLPSHDERFPYYADPFDQRRVS